MSNLNKILMDEPTISGVNIVPVIDLCLVLLIVLMVTSPLLDTADLPVKLPQAQTIESKEANIAVTYASDGRLAINSTVVDDKDFDRTLAELLRKTPGTMVLLRLDRVAHYSVLTSFLARCKAIGATNISIGTEQKPPNG